MRAQKNLNYLVVFPPPPTSMTSVPNCIATALAPRVVKSIAMMMTSCMIEVNAQSILCESGLREKTLGDKRVGACDGDGHRRAQAGPVRLARDASGAEACRRGGGRARGRMSLGKLRLVFGVPKPKKTAR